MADKKKQPGALFSFLYRASEAVQGKAWGISVEFECPICGGKAKSFKDKHNGHYRAECVNCKIRLIE